LNRKSTASFPIICLFAVATVLLWGLASPAVAQARVTFGVVPGGNSLVQNESQARIFADYLSARIGDEVRVRVFHDNRTLHDWISRFRQVDLAILPLDYVRQQPAGEFFYLASLPQPVAPHGLSDPLLARQGLTAAFRSKVQSALQALDATPEGRNVLAALGSGPGAAAPASRITDAPAAPLQRPSGSAIKPATAPLAPVKPKPLPSARPLPLPGGEPLTLGAVPDASGGGWSEGDVRALADCLQGRLGVPVSVRLFQDLGVLGDWLGRYRQVDLALLPAGYLGQQPAGSFFPLAEFRPAGKAGSETLVMRQGLAAGMPQRVGAQLADLSPEPARDQCASPEAAPGPAAPLPAVVASLPASPPPAPPAPAAAVVPSPPAAVVPPVSPAVVAPPSAAPVTAPPTVATVPGSGRTKTGTKPTAQPVTLGLVPAWNTLVRTEAQAIAFSNYMQSRLGRDVAVRLFSGEEELYSWLARNRQLDLAILRLDSYQGENGKIFHLAVYAEVGKPRPHSADLVVLHREPEPGLLVRIQETLLTMAEDPGGRQLLTSLGVSGILPPGKPAPPVLATPGAAPRPAVPAPKIPQAATDVPADAAAQPPVPAPVSPAAPVAPASIQELPAVVVPAAEPRRQTGILPATAPVAPRPAAPQPEESVVVAKSPDLTEAPLSPAPPAVSTMPVPAPAVASPVLPAAPRLTAPEAASPAEKKLPAAPQPEESVVVAKAPDLTEAPLSPAPPAVSAMPVPAPAVASPVLPASPRLTAPEAASPAVKKLPTAPQPAAPAVVAKSPALTKAPESPAMPAATSAPVQAPTPAVVSPVLPATPPVAPATTAAPTAKSSPQTPQPQVAVVPPATPAEGVPSPNPPVAVTGAEAPAGLPQVVATPAPPMPKVQALAPAAVASTVPPPAQPTVAMPAGPASETPRPPATPVAPGVKAAEVPAAMPPVAVQAPSGKPVPLGELLKLREAPAPAKTAQPPAEKLQLAALPKQELPPPPPGPRPIDILREAPPKQKVYIVPFTTLMVPEMVAEGVFDDFVDLLNEASEQDGTEFIILKSGTEKVGHDWLANRTYVTGELFGYVEDSGCCSTEIRARARVHLFRPGQSAPVFDYELPVKQMFDHDRATLDQERSRIARQIAETLSAQVLKRLHAD